MSGVVKQRGCDFDIFCSSVQYDLAIIISFLFRYKQLINERIYIFAFSSISFPINGCQLSAPVYSAK